MILDVFSEKSDFGRYSSTIVNLDVIISKNSDLRRYFSEKRYNLILFYQNTVILDVISKKVILGVLPQK